MLFEDAKVLWRDGVDCIDIYEHSLEEEYIGRILTNINKTQKN